MTSRTIILIAAMLFSSFASALSITFHEFDEVKMDSDKLKKLNINIEEERLGDIYKVIIGVPLQIDGSEYSTASATIYSQQKMITQFSVQESLESGDEGATTSGKLLHLVVDKTIVSEVEFGIIYGNTIYKFVVLTNAL